MFGRIGVVRALNRRQQPVAKPRRKHAKAYRMRDADGTVEGRRSLRIGHPGPVEDVRNRRDRATALIDDIWFEKIHGCSYRGGNTSCLAANLQTYRLARRSAIR